jgi:hypothetical protein
MRLVPWLPLVLSSLVAVLVGQAIVEPLNSYLKNRIGAHPRDNVKGVPPWLIGSIERLVFGPAFYLAAKEAALGALVWLGLKMAANWEHAPEDTPDYPNLSLIHRRHSVRALLMGFISLAIAAVAGLLVHDGAASVEGAFMQLCGAQDARAFLWPSSITMAVGSW